MSTVAVRSESLIATEQWHAAAIATTYPIVIDRAAGSWVWELAGKRYLDMVAGYGAVGFGHGHPRLVNALTDQASRLTLVSRVFHHGRSAAFLEKLSSFSGYARSLLMCSGAEAVETMVKAARRYAATVRGIASPEIIVFDGNFHGRTLGTISASTNPITRDGFGPLLDGYRAVPFGDLAAVEAAIGPHTAAVLIEAVQGRGGVVLPPPGFLSGLRALCDRYGLLLLADEVQAGLGRTGYRFAIECEGSRADGIAIGKSLSGGLYPVSAFLADDQLMSVFTPGSHGSTFGGNPLACAVAEAALDLLVAEDLVARAHRLGTAIAPRLEALIGDVVCSVRHRGLWFALVIAPESGTARAYCERLVEAGILCDACPGNAIRFSPPLTITEDELDHAFTVIAKGLTTLC